LFSQSKPKAISKPVEESGGRVILCICIEKINASYMAMRMIRSEDVESPTMMLKIPINANSGDNADTYNFKNHKTGEGHLNLRKRGMLKMAARLTNSSAVICMKLFIN